MFESLPEEIVGVSPAAGGIRRFIERAASRFEPVTITGEAGTGKELAAKLIHHLSERKKAPFLMIDCSLFYERELRREVFGCQTPAGGGASRKGLLEFASKGTCYLSRIEELSLGIQADLLGFLRDGSFSRLGDGKEAPSSVRLIVSSEKNLDGFVEAGLFDGSLHAELSKLALYLPPLRERREDIPAYVRSLTRTLARHGGPAGEEAFTPEALEALQTYPWPANFEELRREVLRVLGSGLTVVRPEDLTMEVSSYWLGRRGDPLVRKVVEELDAYIREFRVLSRLDCGFGELLDPGGEYALEAGPSGRDILEDP